jgi:hypothetical protein
MSKMGKMDRITETGKMSKISETGKMSKPDKMAKMSKTFCPLSVKRDKMEVRSVR